MRKPFDRHTPRWWAISILAHVVLIVILVQVVFKYPLGQLMGRQREMVPERLQYIRLPAPATESSGSRAPVPAKSSAPAALQPPREVPTTVPPPAPADSARSQAAGGTGAGFGVDGSGGLATGIVPRLPDERIALMPGTMLRTPRTLVEDVDSIVALAIGIYSDSMAIVAAQRKPGDWTIKGKDGKVWGWDPNGNIRLGKFTIPGALLAMLPLNTQSSVSPIDARRLAWIRRDVLENAQRTISEDEFRASVKRIRERKEKEKRQKQLAADTKGQP